jgi:hypothetical protein
LILNLCFGFQRESWVVILNNFVGHSGIFILFRQTEKLNPLGWPVKRGLLT